MFDKFLPNLSDKLEIIDSEVMAAGHINSPASLAGSIFDKDRTRLAVPSMNETRCNPILAHSA
jgi:hypothetical protein